jgi:hypothetical protein
MMMGSSQPGGPGNYNPPIENTPAQRQGTPGRSHTCLKMSDFIL